MTGTSLGELLGPAAGRIPVYGTTEPQKRTDGISQMIGKQSLRVVVRILCNEHEYVSLELEV